MSLSHIKLIEKSKLEEIVNSSTSWVEVLTYFKENFDYKRITSNKTIKDRCIKENIDFSHFKRKSIKLQNKTQPENDINKFLIKGSNPGIKNLKRRLYKEKLLEEKCYECGLGNNWNGKSITLQLEHIDGDHHNNELSNLKILCPNCHSQTSTFCGKNISLKIKDFIDSNSEKLEESEELEESKELEKINGIYCIDCDKKISKNATRCVKCAGIENNKTRKKIINRPSIEQLKKDFKELKYYTKVGEKYNVSDNTIRQWIKVES